MPNVIKVTMPINAPVSKTWELFMNPENLKSWLTGFVSAEHLSGTPGQPGSVSKLKFMERGKVMEVTETVVICEPNLQYAFTMKHDSFENETDIRFLSFSNYTEMIQTVQFVPKGFIMKLFTPLMKGEMKKRMSKELEAFKKFVETKA